MQGHAIPFHLTITLKIIVIDLVLLYI